MIYHHDRNNIQGYKFEFALVSKSFNFFENIVFT